MEQYTTLDQYIQYVARRERRRLWLRVALAVAILSTGIVALRQAAEATSQLPTVQAQVMPTPPPPIVEVATIPTLDAAASRPTESRPVAQSAPLPYRSTSQIEILAPGAGRAAYEPIIVVLPELAGVRYRIDFGDGTHALADYSAGHRYLTPGSYLITATAVVGQRATACHSYRIAISDAVITNTNIDNETDTLLPFWNTKR